MDNKPGLFASHRTQASTNTYSTDGYQPDRLDEQNDDLNLALWATVIICLCVFNAFIAIYTCLILHLNINNINRLINIDN